MALTGPLAGFGKQALLGMKIWEEETNAKGGLLGRQVKLVYYDDQSTPSTVPGIYTKLLDVDKVDLVVSGYATNMVAPAMPVVMQKKKTFVSLFALDANGEFKYPQYFSVLPSGPTPKASFTEGFFQTAVAQNPKPHDHLRSPPRTPSSPATPARAPARTPRSTAEDRLRQELSAEHDRLHPDRARAAGGQRRHRRDLLLSAQLGRHRADRERAELQAEDARRRHGRPAGHRDQVEARLQAQRHHQLRDLGAVREDDGAGQADFFKKYQARANAEGADPLGYYLGGWGYAYISVLGQAVTGAKSIEDAKVADYLRKNEFKTIMGNWSYGPNGEWTKSGMLQVQYHGIKDGDGLDVWKGMSYQTVLTPAELKTGNVIYPYEKAK